MSHAVRWEREELKRSRDRGFWDRWGVQDAAINGGWLRCGFTRRRIYAPLEHRELVSQFAALGNDRGDLLTFVGAYGRLGWAELSDDENKPNAWLERKRKEHERLIQDAIARDDSGGLAAEPVEWILAHARTVSWCADAGRVLNITAAARRDRECKKLADALPVAVGLRSRVAESIMRQGTKGKVSPTAFVAGMLTDYLWINLRGVRRRIEYRDNRMRSLWGGNSLLESIYTMLTDAVTSGEFGQCKSCGSTFIRTHGHERHCPRREGQSKSPCMNRERVRRYRRTLKKERRGRTRS